MAAIASLRFFQSVLTPDTREVLSYKPCFIAVSSQHLFVDGQRLLEQGNACCGLARIVHKHSEIRYISCCLRTIRTINGGIDRNRSSVEQAGLPQVLLVPEDVRQIGARDSQLTAFGPEFLFGKGESGALKFLSLVQLIAPF